MATDDRIKRLRAELERLEAERDELEAALPPHGLKPDHFRRIEDLETRIETIRAELAGLDPNDP